MTVEQLIAELSRWPSQMPVYIYDQEWGHLPIGNVDRVEPDRYVRADGVGLYEH